MIIIWQKLQSRTCKKCLRVVVWLFSFPYFAKARSELSDVENHMHGTLKRLSSLLAPLDGTLVLCGSCWRPYEYHLHAFHRAVWHVVVRENSTNMCLLDQKRCCRVCKYGAPRLSVTSESDSFSCLENMSFRVVCMRARSRTKVNPQHDADSSLTSCRFYIWKT